MISPARTAYVCSGDQLELTCNTTGQFLEWSFSFTLNTRTLTSQSQTDQMSHLVVNSTTFTFSRISGENSLPLISRLLVSPIEDTLNGSDISLVYPERHVPFISYPPELLIRLISEDYGNSSVTVTLMNGVQRALSTPFMSVLSHK